LFLLFMIKLILFTLLMESSQISKNLKQISTIFAAKE